MRKEEIEKMEEIYCILYSYSHKKFYEYIKKPELGFLMHSIIEAEGVGSFISKFTSANVSKYQKHI